MEFNPAPELLKLSRKSSPFIEPEISISCSYDVASGTYPVPYKSRPLPYAKFIENNL
jgi:hypothetical protein